MPDLKSELAKLANLSFDDAEDGTPINNQATTQDDPPSRRELVWRAIRDNPMSTPAEIAEMTGETSNFVSQALHVFQEKGLTVRKEIDGVNRYTTLVDEYPRFDKVAHARAMGKATKGKSRPAWHGTKGKKRAAPKARTKAATTHQAPAPAVIANSVDELINALSIVQARELYDKLGKLFRG